VLFRAYIVVWDSDEGDDEYPEDDGDHRLPDAETGGNEEGALLPIGDLDLVYRPERYIGYLGPETAGGGKQLRKEGR